MAELCARRANLHSDERVLEPGSLRRRGHRAARERGQCHDDDQYGPLHVHRVLPYRTIGVSLSISSRSYCVVPRGADCR